MSLPPTYATARWAIQDGRAGEHLFCRRYSIQSLNSVPRANKFAPTKSIQGDGS